MIIFNYFEMKNVIKFLLGLIVFFINIIQNLDHPTFKFTYELLEKRCLL